MKSPLPCVLFLLTAAATADAAGMFGAAGSPSCADYPPWLPSPLLAEPNSARATPPTLRLNLSIGAYFDFAERYAKLADSLGQSPSSRCCGLAPEIPGLVLAEFDIRPRVPQPHGGGHRSSLQPAVLASLLPFNNSLLQEQDARLVAAMRRLINSGLFGRISLYDFLLRREPELLHWISQSHLFCLAQSRSRVRLVMSRPLNQFEFDMSLRGPFRMDFRLAPCRDQVEDESRATRYSAEVRVLL